MAVTAASFVTTFWVAVLPAFLSFALIALAVHEPPRPAGAAPVRSPLSLRELRQLGAAYWWVTGIAALFTLARFSEAFLILRAQSVGLPVELVPGVLVVMNVVYALSAYPAGHFSDHVDRISVVLAGFAVMVAADLVLAFAGGIGGVAVGVALWGLHMGLTQGLLSALIADAAPVSLRGTAFGMFNLLCGLALLVASVLAGALWDAIGPSGTFLAGAAFTLAALLGLVGIRRRLAEARARLAADRPPDG
jgi:MFS family permease